MSPPGDHIKPVQPGTDLDVGHGDYIEDPDEQDAVWANAIMPETDPEAFDYITKNATVADG